MKEGYCFYTKSYFLKDFEEFCKVTLEFQNLGFNNFKDCAEAFYFGLNQNESYLEFKKSGFLNKDDPDSYKEFLIYKEGGFENKKEYFDAKKLKIFTRLEYLEFNESGFQYYNGYLNAKSHGFNNKIKFDEAKNLGFEEFNQYEAFLKSGCKSKEEFEFFKNQLPNLIKQNQKIIKQSEKDAEEAFTSKRFEEFIRLRFLSIEKLSEALYLSLYKREFKHEDDKKVDDLINEIGIKLNKKLVDFDELKYWRRIRNKVVHQNLKVSLDKAEKGKEFFDEIFNRLFVLFQEL